MEPTLGNRSWLVIDRKEPSADSSFFFPEAFLRGGPWLPDASPDDIAYVVSHTSDLGFRLRGWALAREAADDREHRMVLQFVGRLREPVPLVGPTATLREIFESRARERHEFESWPGPLGEDDIAYLDNIIQANGVQLPNRTRGTVEEMSDVRLSAVLKRDLSETVRRFLTSTGGMATPDRGRDTPMLALHPLSVARALIRYGIENDSKPVNYPGAILTPVVFARLLQARVDPAEFKVEFIEPFEGTQLTAPDPGQITLSTGLDDIVERAAEIARLTTKKGRISLRHLTAALLLSEA